MGAGGGFVKCGGVAGFSPGRAEPPRLAAAAPQHRGVTAPALEGIHEMRGVLHLKPSGMCFGVKHWNCPQRKDSMVRFLAAASPSTPAAEAPRTRPLLGGVWLQGPGG